MNRPPNSFWFSSGLICATLALLIYSLQAQQTKVSNKQLPKNLEVHRVSYYEGGNIVYANFGPTPMNTTDPYDGATFDYVMTVAPDMTVHILMRDGRRGVLKFQPE